MIKKKILIAEDELLIATVLKMELERKEFDVRVVSDEANAIRAALEFNPDLIVLDIYLTNKSSGINAAKEIRAAGLQVPIIFTTGNSYEQTQKELHGISGAHLFIKPVDGNQLFKFIVKCLSV